MKKKSILVLLFMMLILAFGITACGEKEESSSRRDRKERDKDKDDDDDEDEDEDDEDEDDDDDEDDDNGMVQGTTNPLVTYAAPEANWDGTYITDEWSDEQGYIEVDTATNGQLHFHVVFDKYEEDFYGEEQDYDESVYNWGGTYSATCYAYPEGDNNNSAAFYFYETTGETPYISFSYYGNNQSLYASLNKYTPWREAPDDFEDEDPLGYLSEEYEGDEDYFQPASDDYRLEFYLSDSCYDGKDYADCMSTLCKSYDENGFCIDRVTRYVFENEDDAKACYNYYEKNYSSDYYEFNVVGNVVYKHDISSYYDTWDAKTGTTYFYKDCNYWYRPYDIYQDYAYYMYYSIPITSDDFNVDSDAALYYSSIEYGSYQCYEEKDVTLHVDISSQYFDLSVYDYTYNSQYMVSSSGKTRVDGTTVLRFTINESYDYDIGDYVYIPIVQEFVFDGDLCTVTQYTYAASEEIPYDINLDNYSKKNAEDTLEYTFDLSKTVN